MPNSLAIFDFFRRHEVLLAGLGLGSPALAPITDTNTVAGTTHLNIRPPAGESWLVTTITTFGSGGASGTAALVTGIGDGRPFLYPDFNIGEGDADHATIRDGRIFIDNTTWLDIYNANAGARRVSHTAIPWNISSGPGSAKVAVILVAATSTLDVRPPAGETWLLTTLTPYGAGATGARAYLREGASDAHYLMDTPIIGEGLAQWGAIRDGRIFIDNNTYLRMNNDVGVGVRLSYSGVQWQ